MSNGSVAACQFTIPKRVWLAHHQQGAGGFTWYIFRCIFGKHHPRKLQTFASGLIWEKIPRYFQMFLFLTFLKLLRLKRKIAGHCPFILHLLKHLNRWWIFYTGRKQPGSPPWGWRSAQVQRLPFNDRWLQNRHSDEPLKHETIDRALRRCERVCHVPTWKKRFPDSRNSHQAWKAEKHETFFRWLNVFM